MEFDYSLLAKYLAGNVNSEELSAIRAWSKTSSFNAELFDSVRLLRIKSNFDKFNKTEQSGASSSNIRRIISANKRYFLPYPLLRYVAIIVFIIVCGGVGYLGYNKSHEEYAVIRLAEKESSRKIMLKDGSSVWLKGGSSLQIPESFSDKKRSVVLSGEAYFQIKKDSLSPFTVNTNLVVVKVLGTTFNLKAGKDVMEAILIEGRVKLQDMEKHDLIEMIPGEKVQYVAKDKTLNIEQVDINLQGVWRFNQHAFENMTLREITDEISRIYDVHFNFASQQLATGKYRFVFNQDESLEDVCRLIEFVASVNCRIEGREVFIEK